ncbi:MAG: hypothetical protein MZV63_50360 [Marinilabiliales bacterium]|nr:hypothetical protein [Marinilabiliales bacterium]
MLLLRLLLTAAYFLVTVTVALGYGLPRAAAHAAACADAEPGDGLNDPLAAGQTSSGMQYLFLDSLLSVADRLVMIVICSCPSMGRADRGSVPDKVVRTGRRQPPISVSWSWH